MPFGEIGAFLLLLAAVFLFDNIWFHFVEALLERIKKLFICGRKPSAWHTLPLMRRTEKIDKGDHLCLPAGRGGAYSGTNVNTPAFVRGISRAAMLARCNCS